MKKSVLLAFAGMMFVLAACSKSGSGLLDDVSGVWRAQDGGLLTISNSKDGLILIIGEKDVAVKLGEIDEDQGTVNLNVTLNDGKPAIWTLKQIWDKEKKNFTLGFTLHDGTQDELSFVRKVSADDSAIIERNRKAMIAASAPSITTAATADVSELQEAAPSIPAENEGSEPQADPSEFSGGPSFDCAKAGTAIEGMICGNPQASHLDLKLSESYKQYMSVSEDKSAAKQDQIAWIKSARNSCKSVECLIGAYESRISDLDSAAQYLSKPAEFR